MTAESALQIKMYNHEQALMSKPGAKPQKKCTFYSVLTLCANLRKQTRKVFSGKFASLNTN